MDSKHGGRVVGRNAVFRPERRMPQTEPGKFTGLASGRNAQHDLAPVMRSTSKQLVGGAYFFEWKHGADVRNQSSAIKQLRDLVQAICGRIRIKVRSSNAITILDGLGDRRHDRHQNPTRFQNPKRPLLRLASDRIKDNIDSLQGILESLGSIIQNSFSAQGCNVSLIPGGCGRDHMEPGLPGQLDGVSANISLLRHE